jgi:segregation and condensation protein B
MNLEQKLEAILFWKGEPISIKKLEDIFKVSREEIKEAILKLKENLLNRGIVLIENGEEIMLGTNSEMSALIEDLQKEELNRDLSKASLETLSIVLYKNGATRSLIDYVRGVNSSFTLRALSMRGLVEKTTDPKDNRKYIYKPSFELLSFMGVKSVEELPEYNEVMNSLNGEQKNLEEMVKEENKEDANI